MTPQQLDDAARLIFKLGVALFLKQTISTQDYHVNVVRILKTLAPMEDENEKIRTKN